MKKQAFQHGEIRDQNDNILQAGAYGKKTAFANGQNTGILDYLINNLEVLFDGVVAAGLVVYDKDGRPVLPDEIKAALQSYVTAAKASESNAAGSATAAASSASTAQSAAATATNKAKESAASATSAAGSASTAQGAAATATSKAKEAATSASNAAGSAASAESAKSEALRQAELAKSYKEAMFNGTPEGYNELVTKAEQNRQDLIGTFKAINGSIYIKTA